MANPLIASIRARLKEIDEERDHLVALVALYESPESRNGKNTVVGAGTVGNTVVGQHAPFQSVRGGPTDRILAVLAQEPGLSYGEVVQRAMVGLTTSAQHPERSVGSTLQSLVKAEKVERRHKKHYLTRTIQP